MLDQHCHLVIQGFFSFFLSPEIVKILMENGAEKLVENDKGEIASQLTSNEEVRVLLGGGGGCGVDERPRDAPTRPSVDGRAVS